MTTSNTVHDTIFRLQARDLWHESQQFGLAHRVPIEQILGNCQKRDIVIARHAYWHWLHVQRGFICNAIARLLRRNPKGIQHGLDRHEQRMAIKGPVVAEVTVKPKPASIVPRRLVGWDRASMEEEVAGGAWQ